MSTFFEKLTGAPQTEISMDDELFTEPEATLAKAGPRITTQRSAPIREKETHLKVEDGDASPQNASDDDGELTIDIFDDGDAIVIQSIVAGVKPEDLDISITEEAVSIRGTREREDEIAQQNYYYKELFWGSFSRSVIMPEEIDPDGAEAALKHGLLTIRLPKKRKGSVQKLKVKVT